MTLLESLVSLAVVAGVASATFDLSLEVESKVVEYQKSQMEMVKNYRPHTRSVIVAPTLEDQDG